MKESFFSLNMYQAAGFVTSRHHLEAKRCQMKAMVQCSIKRYHFDTIVDTIDLDAHIVPIVSDVVDFFNLVSSGVDF